MDAWTNILNTFKATGATLVFFSDLNIQVNKIEEWMNRRDKDLEIFTDLYDKIICGKTLQELIDETTERKALSSTFYEMSVIAQHFGEFNYSIEYECDLEIAQYVNNNNNVIAVITNDTDFLIFAGWRWHFWSSQEIQITPSNQLKTVEYNRNGIQKVCSLSTHQLPLFATLVGNDFTHIYYDELCRFASSYGPLKYRIQNIARYVHKVATVNMTDKQIKNIVRSIFGYVDNDVANVIKESLASYNIDFTPTIITDPIQQKLLHTPMYRPYMSNMTSIHGLITAFYDMRGCQPGKYLQILLIDWLQRRKGVVRYENKTTNYSFILLASKGINMNYEDYEEVPIYPDCEFKAALTKTFYFLNFFSLKFDLTTMSCEISVPLPPLDLLYLNTTDNLETRWKIIEWIMSIPDETLSAIKQLPTDYLIICTTLNSLVKVKLILLSIYVLECYNHSCIF